MFPRVDSNTLTALEQSPNRVLAELNIAWLQWPHETWCFPVDQPLRPIALPTYRNWKPCCLLQKLTLQLLSFLPSLLLEKLCPISAKILWKRLKRNGDLESVCLLIPNAHFYLCRYDESSRDCQSFCCYCSCCAIFSDILIFRTLLNYIYIYIYISGSIPAWICVWLLCYL